MGGLRRGRPQPGQRERRDVQLGQLRQHSASAGLRQGRQGDRFGGVAHGPDTRTESCKGSTAGGGKLEPRARGCALPSTRQPVSLLYEVYGHLAEFIFLVSTALGIQAARAALATEKHAAFISVGSRVCA